MGKLVKKDLVNNVQERVKDLTQENNLNLPKNYSLGNAMNSAWLKLQETKRNGKSVLQTCSKTSVANALFDMAIQGLNPSKSQCYFVPYGNKLVLQRSYLGTVAAAKRMADIEDIVGRIIYKDDEFEYEIVAGNVKIAGHKQTFKNRNSDNAIGAYAVISFNDDRPDYVELMNLDEIEDAWSQGQIFKKGKKQTNIPHEKFKTEMMKKTVISRAAKKYINSSNDSGALAQSFNRSAEVQNKEEMDKEIEEEANQTDFDKAVEEAEDSDFEEMETPETETTKNYSFLKEVSKVKKNVHPDDYKALKEEFGVEKSNEIIDRDKQEDFYSELEKIAEDNEQ